MAEKKKLMTLNEQADEIKKLAEDAGVQGNFLFRTTFDRYLVQLSFLQKLKKTIDEDGMLVTKEYVKGRGNMYASPAVTGYNQTTDSANRTVSTLMKIIRNFSVNDSEEEEDPLMRLINGDEDEEAEDSK